MLFEIFRGTLEEFKSVPMHNGYAYFVEDTGEFFIDISNEAGGRVQVNAYAAEVLRKTDADGNIIKEIDIDDIFLKDMIATVAQGGTGRDTLTVNALLVGNGANAVKMVSITNGAVVLGDSTNGVKGLTGTGAFYASTSGAPRFGTLPLAQGGTGGTSASSARSNLSVYSKTETENKILEMAATNTYEITIAASNWSTSATDGYYTYTYSNTGITCGRTGNTPPTIIWTSNQDEYSKITSAEATAGTGIVFKSLVKPTTDINVIIIDVK